MAKKRLTYWAPRMQTTLFDFVSAPFEAPLHLEMVEARDESVAVVHELEKSGFVYLGISQAEDPREVQGAMEIVDLGSKPDLRSLRQLTVAYF